MAKSSIVIGWEKIKLSATDEFHKKYFLFLFLSVSNRTSQSIPGVKSGIYYVDQNPSLYNAPLLKAQVDSQVLTQIDSWLKMLSDFLIQINP